MVPPEGGRSRPSKRDLARVSRNRAVKRGAMGSQCASKRVRCSSFGTPDAYARGKAAEFPDEGGPVFLVLDVQADIIARAINDWLPLSQALIQFDPGAGLEELLVAWPTLQKKAYRGSIR